MRYRLDSSLREDLPVYFGLMRCLHGVRIDADDMDATRFGKPRCQIGR